MPQTVIPQLRMRHADTTLPFYVQGTGFVVDWEHRFEPGFPLFAQLTRDGQTIFLTEHSGDCEVGGAVYFIVEDVDALHRAFSAANVPIEQPPHDTEWGSREMRLRDPTATACALLPTWTERCELDIRNIYASYIHPPGPPMGIVNIDDTLHDQLRRACTVSSRSINAQANFWIRVGMLCEMNPALSFQDIVASELRAAGVQPPLLAPGQA